MASAVTARRNLSPRLEGEVGSGGRDHCWVLPLSHSYSSQSWLKQGTKEEEERSKMLPVQQMISYSQTRWIPLHVIREEEPPCCHRMREHCWPGGLVLRGDYCLIPWLNSPIEKLTADSLTNCLKSVR